MVILFKLYTKLFNPTKFIILPIIILLISQKTWILNNVVSTTMLRVAVVSCVFAVETNEWRIIGRKACNIQFCHGNIKYTQNHQPIHVWNQNSLDVDWQSLNVGGVWWLKKAIKRVSGDPFSQTLSVLTARDWTAALKSFDVKYLLNQAIHKFVGRVNASLIWLNYGHNNDSNA